MKAFITPSYTFTPGTSGVGTIDLSSIASFDIKRLIAIINQTDGILIYSTASAALKYTAEAAGVVTLNYDTSAMDAGDDLQIVYESEGDLFEKMEEVRAEVAATATDASTIATSTPIQEASLTSIETGIGAPADAAKTDYSQSGSIIAWLKGIVVFLGLIADSSEDQETLLSAISNKLPGSLGSLPGANSLSIVPASNAVFNINPKTQTGDFSEDSTLSTTAETITAPTGAFACFIEADDTNTTNIRVKMGATATTSSGIQFQPGRSEYYEGGSNISVCMESGTGKISVQWFIRS